jgi:hypothetical protein
MVRQHSSDGQYDSKAFHHACLRDPLGPEGTAYRYSSGRGPMRAGSWGLWVCRLCRERATSAYVLCSSFGKCKLQWTAFCRHAQAVASLITGPGCTIACTDIVLTREACFADKQGRGRHCVDTREGRLYKARRWAHARPVHTMYICLHVFEQWCVSGVCLAAGCGWRRCCSH